MQGTDMGAAQGAAAAGAALVPVILGFAVYLFSAYCFMKIAEKTGTENGWFAFIPILNVVLLLNITGKPLWWIVLFLLPFVNVIAALLIMMNIAEQLGKPSWWGIIIALVPVANIIMLALLAFGDTGGGSYSSDDFAAEPAMGTPDDDFGGVSPSGGDYGNEDTTNFSPARKGYAGPSKPSQQQNFPEQE